MGRWCFLRNSNNRRSVKSILLVKKLLGLVEMTSGLVNASFSLPEWRAVKMIFFALWKVKMCVIRLWMVEGPNPHDQNKCQLHTCCAGIIAAWSTGSRGDVFVVRTSKPIENLRKNGLFWSRYSFVTHSIDRKPRDWGLARSAFSIKYGKGGNKFGADFWIPETQLEWNEIAWFY